MLYASTDAKVIQSLMKVLDLTLQHVVIDFTNYWRTSSYIRLILLLYWLDSLLLTKFRTKSGVLCSFVSWIVIISSFFKNSVYLFFIDQPINVLYGIMAKWILIFLSTLLIGFTGIYLYLTTVSENTFLYSVKLCWIK